MIEFKHLRTLRALQQGGSLAAAAERLHLSASALSHQLAELEQRVGSPLYLRKSRPLSFTREGQWLLELANEFLPKVEALERRLAGQEQSEGPLRLAIECHSCIHWLSPALKGLPEGLSREIEFVTGLGFAPQEALLQGELDLVLTSEVQPSDAIHYQPLFDYEMRLVLAPDHPLTLVDEITPERLAPETLLSYPVESSRLDVVRQFLQPAGLQAARIRQGDNTLMLVQMAAAGWGVTVLPSWVSREFEQQGLVVSRPLGSGLWRRLYGAMRLREKGRPDLRRLLEQVQRSGERRCTA